MSDCRQCLDFEWCMENEECGLFKPKIMNKADEIRALTDERLALFIYSVEALAAYAGRAGTVESWLNWMKEGAEEGQK